jgi:hypothetical protein
MLLSNKNERKNREQEGKKDTALLISMTFDDVMLLLVEKKLFFHPRIFVKRSFTSNKWKEKKNPQSILSII